MARGISPPPHLFSSHLRHCERQHMALERRTHHAKVIREGETPRGAPFSCFGAISTRYACRANVRHIVEAPATGGPQQAPFSSHPVVSSRFLSFLSAAEPVALAGRSRLVLHLYPFISRSRARPHLLFICSIDRPRRTTTTSSFSSFLYSSPTSTRGLVT